MPVWYQKRFLLPDTKDTELLYLDLHPGTFMDPRGVVHPRKPIRRLGPRHCFYERDLYTSRLGDIQSTELERLFFGSIDWNGQKGVEHFADFHHTKPGTHEAFQPLMNYMSTQKLRTPKGLGWLAEKTQMADHNAVLNTMLRLRQIFCAIWAESIWLIADASNSATKFLISDCPVTVYNRRCGPRSQWCRGHNDPDIWLNGTHTIFPLSLNKILILTNLSWVRNPYQNPVGERPNSNPFRDAIFNFNQIQVARFLTEQEVREINFIIKSRALRYVASVNEDWLHPEQYISKTNWADYGNGYLFMPDPRSVGFQRGIYMGFRGGSSAAYDEYGSRPWQIGFAEQEKNAQNEFQTFHRFQGEFAHLFGPYRRGRSYNLMNLGHEKDSDEFHQYHLSLWRNRR